MPSHLVLLTHGLGGSPKELLYIQKTLSRHFEIHKDLIFKIPNCNYKKTSDGILNGAKRLVEWILIELSKYPIDRISFVSHSLGGIYTRCVVGLLHDHGLIPRYLRPINFITLATPHLGSKQHVYLFHNMHAFIVSKFIGQTVLELTMTDSTDPKTTFMNLLCNETYLAPLKMFSNLVAYSNVDSDYTVNYKTGSIQRTRYQHEGGQSSTQDLPQIIRDDRVFDDKDCECIEDEMFKALDTLPWNRFAVLPARALKAHTDIIVRNEEDDIKYGSKVVDHLCQLLVHPSSPSREVIQYKEKHLVLLIPDSSDLTVFDEILIKFN